MTTVRDIMRPVRWTIGPDDTLGRAEAIMARHRIHQLLVVDAGALAGVISEREVRDRRPLARSADWRRAPVRSAMQASPVTAGPDEAVADAIDRLAGSTADVLPIVEHGFLVGELTATELFEAEPGPAEPAQEPVSAVEPMNQSVF